ncbi:hypothetical protein F5Y10DRAFT_180957 [Nemania abortiva]|nr:hypothetical protein F5Y10DRAFT_180957 [Nemania abortiva]
MYKLVSRSWSLREGKGANRHAAVKAPAPVTHVPDEPLHGGPETVSDTTLHAPSYNGFVTPAADASKNALQYASRPLPATPSSKGKMADRPSTSGGPGSRKAAKDDMKFDKRMSRDDFYLGSRAYGGTRPGPYTSFRGKPPTPETSPRSTSVERFASGSSTWEPKSAPVREVPNGDIGMALGSPTHPPTFSDAWTLQSAPRPRKETHPIVSPPASRSSSVDTFDMPLSRKPTGKWKLFNIFTRKPSDQSAQAVSISDPNGLYGTRRPEEEARAATQAPSSGLKSPARSNTTTSRKTPKHKPIIARSQTMPMSAQVDVYDRGTQGSEKLGIGSFGSIPIALDTGPKANLKTGLLNVEIPDVRLERYSVMFNSVLNSNPSLLSRRQANVQKLKSIEDAAEHEERARPYGATRRATSPQPVARSSGLALFPTSKPGQSYVPPKLSPRLRSNTSPALLPSPSRATFDKPPSYRRPSVEEKHNSKHPRHPRHQSPHHHEKPSIAVTSHPDTVEQQARPLVSRFNNDQSNLILESPVDIEMEPGTPETHEAVSWQAWKPSPHQLPPEPKWQMISPSQKTPSTASSNTSSYRKRSPSLASSARTQTTQMTEDFDDVSYPDSTSSTSSNSHMKMTPVEISIARQISVSRQQRKLLQPLRTGAAATPAVPSISPNRKPSHTSPVRMPTVAVGENGRIAETKTSTPTLVNPPELLDPHLALAQNRRSERIVLEEA